MYVRWGTIFTPYSSTIISVKKSKRAITHRKQRLRRQIWQKNMIKEYIGSSADKRVDIIMKNYTRFMGIVDGYIDGLRYMIEAEKDSNSRQNIGELGVRVQTGGMTSDPTAKHAIRNVMTRDALINCDFSGDVLDGVDHPEAYMKDSSVDEDDNEPV